MPLCHCGQPLYRAKNGFGERVFRCPAFCGDHSFEAKDAYDLTNGSRGKAWLKFNRGATLDLDLQFCVPHTAVKVIDMVDAHKLIPTYNHKLCFCKQRTRLDFKTLQHRCSKLQNRCSFVCDMIPPTMKHTIATAEIGADYDDLPSADLVKPAAKAVLERGVVIS